MSLDRYSKILVHNETAMKLRVTVREVGPELYITVQTKATKSVLDLKFLEDWSCAESGTG